jgi:3-phosphoshikimate 1-carboxyvinyltransferase
MAQGRTHVTGLLGAADVMNTLAAMQAYGAVIERSGEALTIDGLGARGFQEPAGFVDFGNSGTGVRLTMGAAAAYPITSFFVGDQSLSKRPMGRIAEPLIAMGAQVHSRSGKLPVSVKGASLKAIRHESPRASAQIKSAVLLAGVHAEGVTELIEPAPSRDHTERMLGAFGARVDVTDQADGRRHVAVHGGAKLAGQSIAVPADPSSAAFPAAAAAMIAGSEILLEDVLANPLRTGFYDTLREMGADVTVMDEDRLGGEPTWLLQVRARPLRGVSPPPARAPSMIDEYPMLAALAAVAEGETRLTGAEELRIKESDRIALMAHGLRACGVAVEELPDGMIIQGRGPGSVPGGVQIETEGDHRIAMAFLVLGLVSQKPIIVDEAEMIATSFPGFTTLMASLGADIRAA